MCDYAHFRGDESGTAFPDVGARIQPWCRLELDKVGEKHLHKVTWNYSEALV